MAPVPATDPMMAPQSSMLLPQTLPPQSMPTDAAGLPVPDHLPAVHQHHLPAGQHDRSSFAAAFDELERADSDSDGDHTQTISAGMQIWESASEDSDFEYGPAVRELRTGRYSKLEGPCFGCEQ
eukprot:6549020-Prymnesium_polylepis.1